MPHALRVVAAELPRLLGQPARALDALYELADRCAREAAAAEAAAAAIRGGEGGSEGGRDGGEGGWGRSGESVSGRSGGGGGVSISAMGSGGGAVAEGSAVGRVAVATAAEAGPWGGDGGFGAGAGVGGVRVWRRRRDAALHAAVNLHVTGKDYTAALARLDWMARCRPAGSPDPAVLSLAGRVHLHLGDLDGAQLCFDAAAAAVTTTPNATSSSPLAVDNPDASLQCTVDAGLLAFARKDYAGAKRAFEAVLAVHPWDATAANNCAAACMYTRDLRGGIRVLEEALTCHATATVQHETLVLNMCSMYELAAAVPAAAKRNLAIWVLHVAPDDLDPACTRL